MRLKCSASLLKVHVSGGSRVRTISFQTEPSLVGTLESILFRVFLIPTQNQGLVLIPQEDVAVNLAGQAVV